MDAIEGLYLASPPTLTDGAEQQLLLDSAGNLKTNAAVTVADGSNATEGAKADAAWSGSGSGSIVAILKALWTALTAIASGADTAANAVAGLQTYARITLFNGTTWDRARGDANGIVMQSGLSSTFWNFASATGGIVNTTTAVTLKTAGGAGVRTLLQTLSIGHDALGAATEIAIRDGAAGTVLWRGKLQTAAKEDTAFFFDPPLRGTANTLMEVVTLTAVTGGVFVNAQGFTGT